MDRTYFFDGQSIGADDLNTGVDLLAENIKHRTVDFFSKGVVAAGNNVFVIADSVKTIKILPFVAYTTSGERVNMYTNITRLALDISDTTTDVMQKYRLRQQGSLTDENFGWLPNVTYTIYVNYIEKGGRPRVQESSGIFYPTRVYSGFEFYALPSGTSVGIDTTDMVRLCTVTFNGENLSVITTGNLQVATIDADKVFTKEGASTPSTYNPNVSAVSMQDHIMCLGSGTPSPTNPHGYTPEDLGFNVVSVQTHEKRMHNSGISGSKAARASYTSALYTRVNVRDGMTDNLIIYNLSDGEYLHANGSWLNTISALTDRSETYVYLQFTYGDLNTPLPNGTYTIGINPTTGNIAIGADINDPANYIVNVTTDSAGENILQEVTIYSDIDYKDSGAFSIARFEWDNTINPKPVSNIVDPAFTNSNFTTKTDLRVFGNISSLELSTEKDAVNDDILKFPYAVDVKRLTINGSDLSLTNVLPTNYITGFTFQVTAQNIITVYPGKCRDVSDTTDITLVNAITKYMDVPWVQGGTTGIVGGLSNRSSGMTTPGISNTDVIKNALHIFVIKNTDGIVDIAIDTNIYGNNINNWDGLQSFVYKRRIGSVYISDRYGRVDSILAHKCTAIEQHGGLMLYYSEPIELTSDMYSGSASHRWAKCGVPPGTQDVTANPVLFSGKFNTNNVTNNRFYSDYLPTQLYISGSTVFDIVMDYRHALVSYNLFDFTNQYIYCIGYFDARNS